MIIRPYESSDEKEMISLWRECSLVVPWNDPVKDIQTKLNKDPELFFVGVVKGEIAGSCMAGFDGHRGWIYYLAVKPQYQKQGNAKQLVHHAEKVLLNLGCPKVNLMVRETNKQVIDFYKTIGYADDPVVVLSKRMETDRS